MNKLKKDFVNTNSNKEDSLNNVNNNVKQSSNKLNKNKSNRGFYYLIDKLGTKKIEDKLFELIYKYKLVIFFFIITVLSLYTRILLLNFKSDDYEVCLANWFNQLKENGGLKALSKEIGNYNLPYMTILAILTYLPINSLYSIKFVSIIFDYILALGILKLTHIIFNNNKHKNIISCFSYGVILMSPTILLNSACWAQADSIYSVFVVWALIFLINEKYTKSFIFLGLAFSFKLQFVFILPLYICIYISKRNFSILNFLIIPIVNFIMCIPAMICGRSFASCMSIYFNQADSYTDKITMSFPNLYSLLLHIEDDNFAYSPFNTANKVALLVTIFVFALIAFMIIYTKFEFNTEKIITFSFISVFVATFFLPQMHDRYLYLGDVLVLLYFMYNTNKIYIPIGIQLISLCGYTSFLFGNDVPLKFMSFVYLIILVIVLKDTYNKYFKLQLQNN